MREWRSVVAAATLGWGLTACAGGPAATPGAGPETMAGPPIQQPGDGFRLLYGGAGGIRLRDTGANIDSVVLPAARTVASAVSPDNRWVAVAFDRGDSSGVLIVDGASGRGWAAHATAGSGSYTLVWAPGSDALGVGFAPAAGASAILIADTRGNVRNVGCRAASRFLAWRPDGQLVVRNARNVYAVAARDCATLATFPVADKNEVRYAPTGQRVTFLRGGSLFVSQYNGAGATQVAPANYRPRSIAWAPNGGRFAFVVNSQQYRDITHVATYDIGGAGAAFGAREHALGVPRDDNPCSSPGGRWVAFDRHFARQGMEGQGGYTQKQKVVRPSGTRDEQVVLEELIRGPLPEDRRCIWIGETHLGFATDRGPRVVDLTTKVAYALADDAVLLYGRVLDR